MPHYVTNHIAAPPSVIESMLVRNDDGNEVVDFNAIAPMPDTVYRGNLGRAEERRYGSNNWRDWSIANWGTKLNAICGTDDFSIRPDHSLVTFRTAWSCPRPVIEQLSRRFPDESIFVAYADEDWGHNMAVFIIRDGERVGGVDFDTEGFPDIVNTEFSMRILYNESYLDFIGSWNEEVRADGLRRYGDGLDGLRAFQRSHPKLVFSDMTTWIPSLS